MKKNHIFYFSPFNLATSTGHAVFRQAVHPRAGAPDADRTQHPGLDEPGPVRGLHLHQSKQYANVNIAILLLLYIYDFTIIDNLSFSF